MVTKIENLFVETNLTLQEIADECNTSYDVVFEFVKRNFSFEFRKARKQLSYKKSKLGAKNPQYLQRGSLCAHYVGIVSDSKGYQLILKPDWYTARKNSKHIFYHHYVVCSSLNLTQIPANWCVHHCDGNKVNNDFSNLVLLSCTDHKKLHATVLRGVTTISKESTLKWVEAHGTPFRRDDIVCSI